MNRLHLGLASIGIGSVALSLLASVVEGQVPMTNPGAAPPAAAPGVRPIDQAMAWMQDAKRNYTAVKDYTCTMVSRENVKGKLKEESIVQTKFRVSPFSIYMRWLSPPELKNQEVAYMHGKNNNQMRVHSKGILKIAGFVSVDVNDPRVLEHSRHTIYEAGIGHLIDHTLRCWETDRKIGRSQMQIAEYDYDNRRCLRLEAVRPERRPEYYAYRSVIFLDKDSKLPIRHESYDWPRAGGPPTGELLESYSYVDLRFNVGLTDKDFSR